MANGLMQLKIRKIVRLLRAEREGEALQYAVKHKFSPNEWGLILAREAMFGEMLPVEKISEVLTFTIEQRRNRV